MQSKYIEDKENGSILKFNEITLSSLQYLKKYFQEYPNRRCVYNTTNLFLWGNLFPTHWTEWKDRLIFYNGVRECILSPVGPELNPLELMELSNIFRYNNHCGNFAYVEKDYVDNNPELKKKFYVVLDEDTADYIYLADSLVNLKGKKLAKKKNFISQFKRKFENYYAEIVNETNKYICLDLAKNWSDYKQEVIDDKNILQSKNTEMEIFEKAINFFEDLGLEGILILIKENERKKPVAFSIYDQQSPDTAVVHFEKYDPEIKGASQLINWETAKFLQGQYKYINREDDLGIPQLRQAKRSYQPAEILISYRLIRKDCKKNLRSKEI